MVCTWDTVVVSTWDIVVCMRDTVVNAWDTVESVCDTVVSMCDTVRHRDTVCGIPWEVGEKPRNDIGYAVGSRSEYRGIASEVGGMPWEFGGIPWASRRDSVTAGFVRAATARTYCCIDSSSSSSSTTYCQRPRTAGFCARSSTTHILLY